MANEVTILVKAKDEARPVLREVRKEVSSLGRVVGNTTKKFDELNKATTPAARSQAEMAHQTRQATKAVDSQGERVSVLQKRLGGLSDRNYNVKVDVDRDGRVARATDKIGGMFTKLAGKGAETAAKIGTKFAEMLPSAIGGALQTGGPVVQTAVLALGAIVATTLSAFIGAALISGILAVLGGGALAAGIAGALKNERIQELLNGKVTVVGRQALNERGDKTPNAPADVTQVIGGVVPKLKSIFEAFSKPFIEPLANALTTLDKALDGIKPKAEEIGALFAPLVDKLAPALMEMATRAWPGIEEALRASVPLLEQLAEYLPDLGAAIGLFFTIIAQEGPGAESAFGTLLDFVATLIITLGIALGVLARLYDKLGAVREILGRDTGVIGFLNAPIRAVGVLIDKLAQALILKDRLEGTISGSARVLNPGGSGAIGGGGIANKPGRATGGIAGGLTRVAERGGEVLRLPQGTMVYANGQSQQMIDQAGGMGGGGRVALELTVRDDGGAAASAMARWFMEAQRTGEITISATA